MMNELIALLNAANSDYSATYEESSMQNIVVDGITSKFVYIEEFRQGRYYKDRFIRKKSTIVQIWFCKFCEMHNMASEREELRDSIESEIVIQFMKLYNESPIFENVDEFKFFTPPPRFDANEVSIMIEFNCTERKCL